MDSKINIEGKEIDLKEIVIKSNRKMFNAVILLNKLTKYDLGKIKRILYKYNRECEPEYRLKDDLSTLEEFSLKYFGILR